MELLHGLEDQLGCVPGSGAEERRYAFGPMW